MKAKFKYQYMVTCIPILDCITYTYILLIQLIHIRLTLVLHYPLRQACSPVLYCPAVSPYEELLAPSSQVDRNTA